MAAKKKGWGSKRAYVKGAHKKVSKGKLTRKTAKGFGGGHIPLEVLEKRATRLVNIVHRRGGKVG